MTEFNTHLFLCTGAFLYVRYSFLLIYNKFCDLSLLHWPLFQGVIEMCAPHPLVDPGGDTLACSRGSQFRNHPGD
jgi:hypothetical protein